MIRHFSRFCLIAALFSVFSLNLMSQTFTEQTSISLSGTSGGDAEWGDYDNDGDLDILLVGSLSKIYRNDGGAFVDIAAGLDGVWDGSGLWGDYDNDGDLDVVICGYNFIKIYRNNAGTFTDINAAISPLNSSSVSWADIDNDGDLDLLHTGFDGSNNVSVIYKNNSGTFKSVDCGIKGLNYGTTAWGDYDNDGDLDLLLNGSTNDGLSTSVYRNDGGSFSNINAGLSGGESGSGEWGDYDNDGDLDILITGYNWNVGGYLSKIYTNAGGVFSDLGAGITQTRYSTAVWGDYDNDGDLDILMTGESSSGAISKIFSNNAGTFSDINAGLTGISSGSASWGDYDKDGDLDIILTGNNLTKIYRNNTIISNSVPVTPSGLTSSLASGKVTLTWNKTTDTQTQQNGLSYNVYIGTSAGSVSRRSPMSSVPSGYRRLAAKGSIQSNSWSIKNLSAGTYYWSVQATDNSFAGSSFATEQTFTVPFSSSVAPSSEQRVLKDKPFAKLTVTESSIAASRQWKYSTTSGGPYTQIISGATTTECSGSFPANGTYYVVCESIFGGVAYSSNEVKIVVSGYIDIAVNMPDVKNGATAWGDYDNDGDLDVLITGSSQNIKISKIFRNNGGNVFEEQSIALPGVEASCVKWGDYDNDGDLDILLTGYSDSDRISKIFRNNGDNTFTEATGITLPGLNSSSAAWGDYDNDGDLDLVTSGNSGSAEVTLVYRNDNGVFTDINASLAGAANGSVEWGDFDNDGDLDILMTGFNASLYGFTKIYRNDSGAFTEINTGIPGDYRGMSAWGDYDNDGDLDVLVSLYNQFRIYTNNNGTYTELNTSFPQLSYCRLAWGDLDNDGDLDFIVAGNTSLKPETKIFRNNNNTFIELPSYLEGISAGSVDMADYDNDGDLDILLTGSSFNGAMTKLYLNYDAASNSIPTSPSNLAAAVSGTGVTLSWNKATDAQTLQNGLSYNLYIGSAPGTANKKPAMSALPGGYRRVPVKGKVQGNTWIVRKLTAGTYFWSVQATDNAFAGSPFATEGTFTIPFSLSVSPAGEQILGVNQSGTPLNVTESIAPASRQWKYSSVSGGPYNTSIPGGTTVTFTPKFGSFGTYYVVCEAVYNAVTYTSNEVKITVPAFTELTGTGLPSLSNSIVEWGDYDNDNDLDLVISGYNSTDGYITRIYNNNNGSFNDITAGLPGLQQGSAAWGDYDNDGDLDLLLTGWSTGYISKIFNNNAGIFTDISAGLTGIGERGSAKWADYDNDGDLDILLAGYTGTGAAILYRNDAGTFTDVKAQLTQVTDAWVSWGDYDNDGDVDILLAGSWNSRIYRNDLGNFTDINAGIIGISNGSAEWADYDGDGDLDIMISGSGYSRVYRNDMGIFTDIQAGFTGLNDCSVNWGDYDNDGDPDLLVSGNSVNGSVSKIYNNNSGTFTDINAGLSSVARGSLKWGDYDKDGDLDIALTGSGVTKIYRNNVAVANTPPDAPGNPTATLTGSGVTFSWNKAQDSKTTQDGLSYNIYIGTSPLKENKRTPMAALPGGYRKITSRGMINQNTWKIKNLTAGTYYWGVQALDNNFAGSAFSTESSFTIPFSISVNPAANQSLAINQNGQVLIVNESSTPTSRQWKYSTTSGGPYDKVITGATSTTWTPVFSSWGTYYVVCESVHNGITYTSNEIKFNIVVFSEQTGIVLTGLTYSPSADWGDYDNDGDLDLVISGYSSGYITRIYNNNAGAFTDISAGLPGVYYGCVKWGDYDNDNDLDLFISGYSGSGKISKIYTNNSGAFAELATSLPGVAYSSCEWGDLDNDGDLDLIITGNSESGSISRIFRNDSGTFTDVNAGLTAVDNGSVKTADYDNDGDQDIALTGNGRSFIYRNDNGKFTDINAGLTGNYGTLAWGDYDSDGDPDLLMAGNYFSGIYRNDNGLFTDINAGFPSVSRASSQWGDYDNDGDLDLILSGNNGSSSISKIFRNDAGVFTDINANIASISEGSVLWGDYDKDNDLDLLLTGDGMTKIYKNNIQAVNSVPSAPSGLTSSVSGTGVTLSWTKSTDSQTIQNGLTYNFYVGTTPGTTGKRTPMAVTPVGYRKIVQAGSLQNNSVIIKKLTSGTYYWSVQAIDNSYSGSVFATEGSFNIPFSVTVAPVADQNIELNQNGTVLTASESPAAASRQWKYSTVSGGPYTQVITGATGVTLTPKFQNFGTYYVICESFYNSVTYSSNEVKISVPAFTYQSGISIPGIAYGSTAWADYDNDGDYDFVITGETGSASVSKIYTNTGGIFTESASVIEGVNNSSVSWGDYDRDSDLDLVITGHNGTAAISKIYRNDGGTFTDLNASLTGVNYGSAEWGDYDNDGDLDLLLNGYTGSIYISKIYRNINGTFNEINSNLSGIAWGVAKWGDYDNDSDLDVLLAGSGVVRIYRNDNGSFTQTNQSLTGLSSASADWGDYDNDGDLDILVAGSNTSKIYRNDGGIFNDINASIRGIMNGSSVWADIDNDGDLDIILSGGTSTDYFTTIYLNDNSTFTEYDAGLPGVGERSTALPGDYDNDGDLDILLTGYTGNSPLSRIYRNNFTGVNTAPSAPSNLGSSFESNKIKLTWNKSTDVQTPQNGLSYNLYVGTTAGSIDKISPMSILASGKRKIVRSGPIQGNSWYLKDLGVGTYYWSVQAIDKSFAGSSFATEGTFSITFLSTVSPTTAQVLAPNQAGSAITVAESSQPDSRQWKYSTVSGGPYDQVITGAVNTSYTPSFPLTGTYYVICESTKGGVAFISNEVNVNVSEFTLVSTPSITAVRYGSTEWGDYDNDGDYDLLLTGRPSSGMPVSKVYRNDSGTLTDISAGLPGVYYSSVSWGDFDNDSDLDILITGFTSNKAISAVYRNDAGVFNDISASLPAVYDGSSKWGDYDNDGDLDILITGFGGSGYVSKIYRNDSGVFTDIMANLPGVRYSSVAWCDFDNDSDLDILLTGSTASASISRIFKNNNGVFSELETGITNVTRGSVACGDYDNDGDADILLTGSSLSIVYRNDNGLFTDIGASLEGVSYSAASWTDFDNDGDLDILIAGMGTTSYITRIYRNDNGTFTNNWPNSMPVLGIYNGSTSWGDADNDGDPDLLITGYSVEGYISKLYRNLTINQNTPPAAPSGLTSTVSGSGVSLNWNKSTDNKTSQNGLTYNIFIGISPGAVNKRSPMADISSGFRKIVREGDMRGNSWLIRRLPAGNYFWSVQAIDNSFAGSAFSTQSSFTIAFSSTIAPATDQIISRSQAAGTLTVTETSAASSRQWKYSSVSGGPYDQTIAGATGLTCSPSFQVPGIYYIICESVKAGITYTSNEVKVIVTDFINHQSFNLPDVVYGSSAWADYDGDGDLDILMTGSSTQGAISRIYRNDLGVFNDIGAGLTGVYYSSVAWADYDNDGDPDILLSGYVASQNYISVIYRNDEGIFTDIGAGLEGVYQSSAAWGDYDLDGDPDILLTGTTVNSNPVTKIYRNDNGSFQEIPSGLPGIASGSAAWGDYDVDGDPDILLAGNSLCRIFRNDNGTFTDINASLPGISSGSAIWTDNDNDGDPDVLIAGSGYIKIYNNNNGVFSESGSSLPAVTNSVVAAGDLDADGDNDFVVSGNNPYSGAITRIYRNDNGTFNELFSWLPGAYNGSVAITDYDNDGDLDILLTGTGQSGVISRLLDNNSPDKNTIPSAPSSLQVTFSGNRTNFSWNGSTDSKTPQVALTYNIYIGTSAGTVNRKSPLSIIPGGFRKVVSAGTRTNTTMIEKLPAGKYYWSVQAIDNSFAGSPFAPENSFTVPFSSSISPTARQSLIINQNGTALTDTESSAAASRQWKYSLKSGGPYDQSIPGATGLSYTPNFSSWGVYFVICESVKDGVSYQSNEVIVDVSLFTEQKQIALSGLKFSSVAWGDYDNDNDLDLLVSGSTSTVNVSRIYRNDKGVFTDINAGLPNLSYSSLAWGDYDNDNDLDILLTGNGLSRIYRNTDGTFTDISAGLPGISSGSASWADFDNDGDLDILLTGYGLSKIFKNENGIFSDINTGLTGVLNSSAAWADFDNDGDQDLVLTGSGYSKIYRNDNGTFTDISAGLAGVEYGSAAWADYDNDGDPDLLISGNNSGNSITKLFRNDNGAFPDMGATFTGVNYSSASWGDYDNDGDADILLTGNSRSGNVAEIYRNDIGTFTKIESGLPPIQQGSVTWGDYDNDNDLDIAISGYSAIYGPITRIYKNNITSLNTAPSQPASLTSSINGNSIILGWSKSTDVQTSQSGLSYNIYIGTSASGTNKKSPMSSLTEGYRRVTQKGSVSKNNWPIKNLPLGTYYWSVQAIDNSFIASKFATEGTFTVVFRNSIGPVTIQTLSPGQSGNALTVTESGTPLSRQWKYSTISGGPYQSIPGATGTSYTPVFNSFGSYFVICESVYGGMNYVSNEVKIKVPAFTGQTTGLLAGVYAGSVSWGDYDNDGDKDVLLTGNNRFTIYGNNSGIFNDIGANLPGFTYSVASWGDFDNDNDLDILVAGNSGSKEVVRIYRNDAGKFTDIEARLQGISSGSATWGDYDNDGDADILLSGSNTCTIYRNDAGIFSALNASLPGVSNSCSVWGDYDNDGDLDLLITGESVSGEISKIYRNDNGAFTDINANLTGVSKSSAEFGDYDNDGDLDILLTGQTENSNPASFIYRNDAGTFTDIGAGLPRIYNGSVSWADYDNDGDLDVFFSGNLFGDGISRIYRNDSGIFNDINDGFAGTEYSSAAWGDYDNDGDLDLALTGNWQGSSITRLYSNNASVKNDVPSAPSNLQASLAANKVTFTWSKSTDSKTAQNSLGYNLYIGSSAGSVDRKSPMAALPGGYRKVVRRGLQTNSWSIRNLPAGTYYWSVQAIDNSYEGSPFAAEKFFNVAYSNSIAPVADQNLTLSQQGTTLTVTESSAPLSRQWKYSTVSGGPYNQIITGASGQSWTPSFTGAGTYYVVCVSTKDAYSYISNEVRINVMTFTEQSQINLNQVGVGTTSWCDFDNDGDLDLLVAGATSNSMATGLYRNDAGTFTIVNAGLPATLYCSSSWGDYDNDGYADLLMTGYIGTNSYFTRIYRNNAGVFSDINAGLPGVYQGSAVWGDFDNDGDQDIALCGATSSTTQISRIYENRNGTFTEINAGIEGLRQSFVSWADYDNDGDLDLLLSGNSTTTISKLYRNDNGTFTDVNAGFTGVRLGSGAWGDYDNDGDADLLLSGYLNDNGSNVYSAKIYRNDAGIFTDIVAGLRGTYFGTASWSDYDNDGDLDILLSGNSGILETTVYRNDNGIFTGSGIGLKQLEGSSASWGDYDNDGDLDFVLSGSSSDGYYTKVYKNHTLTANTPANAPTGLQSTAVSAGRVRLSWNKGTDTQTPQNALNYNLRIGTSTGAINKAAPASSPSGYRRIPAIGNAGLTSGSYFISLPLGKYYWSVQAIDQAFAGGAWSAESTFTVLAAPVAIPATGIQSYSFNAKWNSSAGATGYRVDVATDAAFTSMVTGYNNTDAGNATSLQVSGLNPNTTYYYRVRAYCSDGTSAGSNVVNLMTLIVPPAAPSGLTIKSCSDLITLTWTANTEANFSKYVIFGGSSTNPNTRMDSISSISTVTKTISGLVHGQTYYFRVKAVNTGGAESQFSTQVSSVVSKGHIPVIKTKFKNDLIVCYNPGDSISQWQWYKETTAISGQTKQYYKAGKNPGEYYVVTTDKNGCVNTSNKIKLTGAAAMVIWPNPASSNFTVKLNSDATGEAVISLYNSSGRKILEKRTEKNNTELLYQMIGGQLMKGIYTLEIIVNEDEVSRTPVVIAK